MKDFEEKVTRFLQAKKPFFFVIDFLKSDPQVYTFEEAAANRIFFDIKGITNENTVKKIIPEPLPIALKPKPLSLETYEKAFRKVKNEIFSGNSFLLNLTFPTPLETSVDLETIYQQASAPYKLLYKDKFVIFSPECYLKFKEGYVYSYPMKGTINSAIPNAREKLLTNQKELQEHHTIVDLIRNDLSMIANEVTVTKFRYIETIKKGGQELLQTSTEIRGKLPENWKQDFSSLLLKTLPAGSISGAPKKKTLDIISEVELSPRGFYTGIFGVFDGMDIDSAVSIRFIEKQKNTLVYKSGGGITHLSTLEEEYQELLEKIYVPVV
ncbi:aminodeoxychorismate synthase component I [Maribacter sp. X9]|uniref:aminodeoxychorismate synthase component I n=1 Tax=Maribacter sp. X9 TaxID=3402159 RepID=UPI003AF38B03